MTIYWKGVKKDYEAKGEPFTELAGRYNCRPETIRRRARKEGWVVKKRDGGRNASEKACDGGCPKKLSVEVWNKLVKGMEEEDAKKGLDEIKRAKMAREVLTHLLSDSEEHLGEELAGHADKAAEEMERVTVSPGTEQALDGEQTVRGGSGRTKER